jgi:hypothetical protein
MEALQRRRCRCRCRCRCRHVQAAGRCRCRQQAGANRLLVPKNKPTPGLVGGRRAPRDQLRGHKAYIRAKGRHMSATARFVPGTGPKGSWAGLGAVRGGQLGPTWPLGRWVRRPVTTPTGTGVGSGSGSSSPASRRNRPGFTSGSISNPPSGIFGFYFKGSVFCFLIPVPFSPLVPWCSISAYKSRRERDREGASCFCLYTQALTSY